MEQHRSTERRAYRVNEFSEAYRVSRPTIYRLLKSGVLVSVKVGSRTLIPVDSAEAWWHAQAASKAR